MQNHGDSRKSRHTTELTVKRHGDREYTWLSYSATLVSNYSIEHGDVIKWHNVHVTRVHAYVIFIYDRDHRAIYSTVTSYMQCL